MEPIAIQNMPLDQPIVTTPADLFVFFDWFTKRVGLAPIAEPAEPIIVQPAMVATRQAKKLLEAKGYRVKSCVAFNNVLNQFGVKGERKGQDNWYKVKELEALPDK